MLTTIENTIGRTRLDNFFIKTFPNISGTKVREMVKGFLPTFIINGSPAIKVSQTLKLGDKISFNPELFEEKPKKATYSDPPQLNIVYEDDDILVIDKTQGVCCHHGDGVDSGTIEDALYFRLDDKGREELGDCRFGLVHRIDKDTSGLLLIAKNKISFENLQKQFRERGIYKEYAAVAWGIVIPTQFFIETGIRRSHKNRKKFETCAIDEGRYSYTVVTTVDYYKDKATLLSVVIHTGRTHQIRVHLRSVNNPIVGDPLYSRKRKDFPDFTMMLHAHKIKFTHPTTQQPLYFISPIPERFEQLKKFLMEN